MSEWEKFWKEFFTIGGRLGRNRYNRCLQTVWLPYVILYALRFLLDDVLQLRETLPHLFSMITWLMVFAGILLIIGFMLLMPRRLHDMNKSGWWTCLLFMMIFSKTAYILILIVAFSFWLGRTNGSAGANRFGEPPDDD